MPQPIKPTSEKPKTDGTDKAMSEAELAKVSGGKVEMHDITITKQVDKSSPKIG
jgi:type VI protein secretion system component Hcp